MSQQKSSNKKIKKEMIHLEHLDFFVLLIGLIAIGVILTKPEGVFSDRTRDIILVAVWILATIRR